MNDDLDLLEAELANLRLRSPSPELRQRIAVRLHASARRFWRTLVGICVLTVVVSLALRHASSINRDVVPSPEQSPATPHESPEDESLPTLQVYRRALNRSSEELDGLLDRHASTNLHPRHVHGFQRSNVHQFVITGEP